VGGVGRGGDVCDLVLQAEELGDDDAEDGEAEGDAEVGEVGAFEGWWDWRFVSVHLGLYWGGRGIYGEGKRRKDRKCTGVCIRILRHARY